MLPCRLSSLAQTTSLGLRRTAICRIPPTSGLKQPFSSVSSNPRRPLRRPLSKMSSFFASSHLSPTSASIFSRFYSNGYQRVQRFQPNSYTSITRLAWAMMSLNFAVFATWLYADATKDIKLSQWLYRNFTLSKDNIMSGRYHTLLTSAFSHQEPTHFLFNMVALNTFASVLGIVPGVTALHVAALAVGSAVASSLAFFWHQKSRQPARAQQFGKHGVWAGNVFHSALGASGLVMGLSGAATCLLPLAPMTLMLLPISIPLFVITGAYAAIDTYYLDAGGRVGHAAHLGGLVFGMAYYVINLRRFGGVLSMLRRR